MNFRDFQTLVLDKVAEPYSEEGKAVIHDGESTHVSELWEDGEITFTKKGDLYRQRRLHQMSPPLLPEGNSSGRFRRTGTTSGWSS